MSIIELNNATYTYPASENASIKNLTLQFEEGKFYAIIGKNGSGKSTLCSMIRGFIPHFYKGHLDGTVNVYGKNINDYSMGELALNVGYIFQNPFNQITGIKDTVFEEIAYGLENFGVEKNEIIDRVNKVIDTVGIKHLKDSNPFSLSGGQQQKVALASIIVLEPNILVIDEPTSQLDPEGTEQVFNIINILKEKKKTIILVEHKVDMIVEYADEVIVLNDGMLLKQGNVDEVFSDINLNDYGCLVPQTSALLNEFKLNNIKLDNTSIKFNNVVKSISNALSSKE